MSLLFIYVILLRFMKMLQNSNDGVIANKTDSNPYDDTAKSTQ